MLFALLELLKITFKQIYHSLYLQKSMITKIVLTCLFISLDSLKEWYLENL